MVTEVEANGQDLEMFLRFPFFKPRQLGKKSNYTRNFFSNRSQNTAGTAVSPKL